MLRVYLKIFAAASVQWEGVLLLLDGLLWSWWRRQIDKQTAGMSTHCRLSLTLVLSAITQRCNIKPLTCCQEWQHSLHSVIIFPISCSQTENKWSHQVLDRSRSMAAGAGLWMSGLPFVSSWNLMCLVLQTDIVWSYAWGCHAGLVVNL